jgi:hypothetical protein
MTNPVIIISKCAGINNVIDPKRLKHHDPNVGLTDIAEGQNIDIDDSGQISTRLGKVLISSIPSHSLFCDGGDCFVAQDRTSDTALYKVGLNLSLIGIRSSLTKGLPFSYFQAGDETYYSNGIQNGRILNEVSSAWPVNAFPDGELHRVYSSAPVGKHIAYFLLRAWIAVDDTIYISKPGYLGSFRMAKYYFRYGSDIRMIRPVASGVWVSDSEATWFITPGETFESYRSEMKSEFPAHEWSDNNRLVDLSKTALQIPGLSAVWSSDEGLCIGTSNGQLIVVTKNRLFYPTGTSGATVVNGSIVINNVY